jgi:hypothetical protein
MAKPFESFHVPALCQVQQQSQQIIKSLHKSLLVTKNKHYYSHLIVIKLRPLKTKSSAQVPVNRSHVLSHYFDAHKQKDLGLSLICKR